MQRPKNAQIEEIRLLEESGKLTDIFEGAIEYIYYRTDTMISNSIDFDEFKEFSEIIGQPITSTDFTTKILDKYCSTERGLTLKGFKEYFKQ